MPNAGLIFSKRIGYWFCVCGWLFLSSSNFVLAQSATARNGTASISGRVTIEGKPAAGAAVSAVFVEGSPPSVVSIYFERNFQTRADAEGHYEITGLRKGKYQLKCLSDAYVEKTSYGFASQMQRTYTLDEGEQVKDVNFALVRGGVITGRITDAEGKPLIEEGVWLELVSGEGQPNERWTRTSSGMRTDDRGIYRLFGLTPGKYRVSVGSNEGGNPYQLKEPIPQTYHPGVNNVKEAKVIEVKVGSENENIDIRVSRDERRYFIASGKIIDANTGQPLAGNFSVYADPQPSADGTTHSSNSMSLSDPAGQFTLPRLLPGRYRLRLDAALRNPLETFAYYTEPLTFTIADGDVTGLEFKVRRGATVSGKVVLEGATGNDAHLANSLMQTMLILRTLGDIPAESIHYYQFTNVRSDRSFKFEGVTPGSMLFESRPITGANNVPGTLALVRVEKDGVPQPEGLVVTGSENITNIKLVFAQGTGSIRGTVQVTNGSLEAGYQLSVSLIRKGHERQVAWAQVDDKGRFVIEGLLADEYKLLIAASHHDWQQFPLLVRKIKEAVTVTNAQPIQITLTFDLQAKEER